MAGDTLPDLVQSLGGEALSLLGGTAAGVFVGARYQDRLQRAVERRKRLRYARRIAKRQHGDGGVSVAGLETRVHIVEGDGRLLLEPAHIQIRLDQQPVELPPFVEAARARALERMSAPAADGSGVEAAWNSEHLVGLLGYRISRTGAHEDSQLQLSVCPTDYATFTATVTGLDDEFEAPATDGTIERTTVRRRYFPDAEATARVIDRPIPELAHGLGVALLVFTDDDKVLLARRRDTATARPGERDVSVVEGMHTEHDRSSAGTLDVVTAAIRGCEEELGIQVGRRDVRILALGVDLTYYQWSFIGLVTAPYTAAQVLDRHALHARDRWESRLEAVPAEPRAVFERLKQDGVWDLGLVTAYLALCHHGDVDDVHRAAVEVYGQERRRSPLPRLRPRPRSSRADIR
jgi:hypothetical protein